jgi:medium-chain acyl-[acyl-carrier-protein] hydrolase
MPDPHPRIHALPEPEFLTSLENLNGIPAEVSQHTEMMELLSPMIRADFEAVENYHYDPAEPPLDCPIVAFGGAEDPRVSRERLEAWAVQTRSRFETIYFPGDHFFINSARDSVLRSVSEEITASYSPGHQSI